MSDPEQPGGQRSIHGHQYQQIQIGDGARAQLGDTYHISQFLAEISIESYYLLTYDRPRKPSYPSPNCNKCAIQLLLLSTRTYLPP